MSRENLCYAGAVVMCAVVLVLWCWCCGAGAGAVVLVLCAGVGRLGFLVDQFCTHSSVLYHPLGSDGLTPLSNASGDQLLACLVAWPTRLVHGRYLCVSHVDKIIFLMIINSASFKFDCHLYYHGGFSPCILLSVQVIRRMKKKKKNWMIKII
jgi:hypothetical protein